MRTEFIPEVILERNQQAALALNLASEGFEVIQLIARSEVDKFMLDAINVPSGATDHEKLEKLRVAKVAAQLYEGIVKRLNYEVQMYTLDSRRNSRPSDPTEGMLDIGDFASRDEFEMTPLEEGINEF